MGVLVVDAKQTQAAGAIPVTLHCFRTDMLTSTGITRSLWKRACPRRRQNIRSNPGSATPSKAPGSPAPHTKLGILQKNQYAAPHICASTRPAAPIAPTRQMIFSPSPTAGRKIRVYVLKAGAVYQK